jgi:hypothetical protein
VIIQPEAVSNIAVPTLERMLAIQITVKAAWPKAPHRVGAGSKGAAREFASRLKLISSERRSPFQAKPLRGNLWIKSM